MNKCNLKIYENLQDYSETLLLMQDFTNNRTAQTNDEIWLLQHKPVYTYGSHTQPELPQNGLEIETIETDRGGNITYHGPGQIVIYTLLDTRRLNYSIHGLIERLESLTVELLNNLNITSHLIPDRRGVYVNNAKIASLGLRFKKFCSYHGLAINVDLDLTPFKYIKPCGYLQKVTSIHECGVNKNKDEIIIMLKNIIPNLLEVTLSEDKL